VSLKSVSSNGKLKIKSKNRYQGTASNYSIPTKQNNTPVIWLKKQATQEQIMIAPPQWIESKTMVTSHTKPNISSYNNNCELMIEDY
jgi:hypothetical protein